MEKEEDSMRVLREGHEMREKADGKCMKKYSSYCVTGFLQIFAWVGSVFRNLDSTIYTIEVPVDDEEKL